MPIVITEEFKGKELYFDLRPLGAVDLEGFWAVPVFDSDRQRIAQECEAKGMPQKAWIETLVFALRRWEGFRDVNNQEIPRTDDNIRTLCEADFVQMMSIYERILNAGRAGKLVAEKN